jgi:hypothetical protein
MLFVWAILGFAGALLLLLVILVATPMHLRLVAEAGDSVDVRAEIRTFWGLSPPLTLKGERHAARMAGVMRRPRKRTRRAEAEADSDKGGGISAAQVSRLLSAVPEALSTALGRIHLDALRLWAAFGFDDPADTGQVFGQLTPWIYGLPCRRCEIGIEPDFEGRRFEGRADLSVHLTPLAVAWPVLRLILKIRAAGE